MSQEKNPGRKLDWDNMPKAVFEKPSVHFARKAKEQELADLLSKIESGFDVSESWFQKLVRIQLRDDLQLCLNYVSGAFDDSDGYSAMVDALTANKLNSGLRSQLIEYFQHKLTYSELSAIMSYSNSMEN